MLKRKKVILIILAIVIAAGFFIFQLSDTFSPGSYPYAEKFQIEADEAALIKAIDSFKTTNPIYALSEGAILKDGRRNSSDHWYHIYFYYTQEDQIVKTWVRHAGNRKVTLAFVGINDGPDLGNWRLINKDFTESENRAEIEKFKERILNRVVMNLKPDN